MIDLNDGRADRFLRGIQNNDKLSGLILHGRKIVFAAEFTGIIGEISVNLTKQKVF